MKSALTIVMLLGLAQVAGPVWSAVPVVRFQAETQAGWSVAAECDRIWQAEGPALVAGLLPQVSATVDTIGCLVLDTPSFRRVFGANLPDWGVGVAVPSGRLIGLDYSRLPTVGRGVREVFLHEMVHALLFRGARGKWLPTWLHEGAAMCYGGEWRFTDTVSLVLDGRVPDLAALQGPFPGSAYRADRAYRTSLLAVNRLRRQYGPDVVAELVAATARTGDFAEAFVQVTGETDVSFYRGFSTAMQLRFGWLVLLTRWPGLFVLLAVVLLVGGSRKLLLSRRRLAEMADDESVGPPGPPFENEN